MSFLTLVLLATGLAMDCLAVSASCGIAQPKPAIKKALLLAGVFGIFQAFMPLVSWIFGSLFAKQIQDYDHWLAFVILSIIGGKMLYESFQQKEKPTPLLTRKTIILLALATSIDALATGFIFVGQADIICKALLIIGTISFLFSITGFVLGWKFREIFQIKFDLLGGIILIAIGVKILVEHLFF
jgi:putative Mn2+ efflux pump MntP